jgi:cation diffusion facilitator family transporter
MAKIDIKIKLGLFAFGIVAFQSILKLIGVILTNSLSYLSETVDTLIDVFFVSMSLYLIYQSQKPPDYKHMYGHSKIDSLGGVVQGVILIIIYGFLMYNAIQTIILMTGQILNPNIGFLLLIISFLVNLIFSRFLMRQGKKKNSLTLRMEGLNLFQDSVRALIVIINFILIIFFNLYYLDPYISIIISIWIVYTAIKLVREGIRVLVDVNPIDALILEDMKLEIFKIEHVNGVEDLKIRASNKILFIEIQLSVEDHISIVHANEIIKIIRAMGKNFFPSYNVEIIIEMNPLGGEPSLSNKIINLLYSMKTEFPKIIDFKDLNLFRIEDEYFLSLSVIVDESLTLKKAHTVCNDLETQLKEQEPLLSRIITHIESKPIERKISRDQLFCTKLTQDELNEIKLKVKHIIKSETEVKDFHGLEVWRALDTCILELHVLFDGNLNISKVHDIITNLENKIRRSLEIENLDEIILHSEPI